MINWMLFIKLFAIGFLIYQLYQPRPRVAIKARYNHQGEPVEVTAYHIINHIPNVGYVLDDESNKPRVVKSLKGYEVVSLSSLVVSIMHSEFRMEV